MNSYTPSYLFKNRFDIFHFRARIPRHIRTKYQLQKEVVQKSLGTANRSKALKHAREWWVRMKDTDYLNKINSQIENDNDLLEEGRKVLAELNSLSDTPECLPNDITEFLFIIISHSRKSLKICE